LRYFTFILLLFSFAARAQTLQGIVTDAGTGKPLYPVTIINVATQQATYSDERGLYTISANPGDVIAFSYVGYKTIEKVKPPSVLIATLDVQMERVDYALPEFKFRPGNLTPYQVDSIERASIYKVQLQRRPPSPFVSPVSAIAEKFSKRAKRNYQFQKDFAAGEIEKFVDTRYTTDLVKSLTGLTGDSVGHFMNTYPMPYDFARAATDLEIQMWIRDNYKDWIRKNDGADR
jgi:hypothetical protein